MANKPDVQRQRVNKLITRFDFDAEGKKWKIISDVHFDNPKCRRDLFFRDLDKCKSEGRKVIIPGDFFCLMQGKGDWRGSKQDVLPQHQTGKYIDSVINEAADLLEPYAHTIAFISPGNHEGEVLKRHETNVIERLVERLNDRTGANIMVGGYRGLICLNFWTADNHFIPYKIYYHHGYGGGGEVTKGTIQHNRMLSHIQGVDMIVMGHVHEQYVMMDVVEYFDSNSYDIKRKQIALVRTSTYKDEYCEDGFHVQKGRKARPLGGIDIDLEVIRTATKSRMVIANINQRFHQ